MRTTTRGSASTLRHSIVSYESMPWLKKGAKIQHQSGPVSSSYTPPAREGSQPRYPGPFLHTSTSNCYGRADPSSALPVASSQQNQQTNHQNKNKPATAAAGTKANPL